MIKLINSKVFNKKVGITFFSECVKSAILLKNEFSHFAFLNKSSILNGLSKTLSRLFTAIASLEKFINGRKVTHIITTFFRGNGANTTFLIKSHDTKKVGITILLMTLPEGVSNLYINYLLGEKLCVLKPKIRVINHFQIMFLHRS